MNKHKSGAAVNPLTTTPRKDYEDSIYSDFRFVKS